MLARVSIVNQSGVVLLDKYIKPKEPVRIFESPNVPSLNYFLICEQFQVVDYRTDVSGIRPRDLENGEDFFQVRQEVANLIDKRILVGHALYNDLKVLLLTHPPK